MDNVRPRKKNIPRPTNFGANMKYLRKSNALSQTSFAESIGISRNSIASYESGTVEPNAVNFLKICNFFDFEAKVMLQDELWEDHSEERQNESQVKKYIMASFTEFLTQTNEMSKVLNGYQEFYKMRRETIENDANRDLLVILDDLLALLKSLIEENKKLLQNVISDDPVSAINTDAKI